MPAPSAGPSGYQNSETSLGGADAVPDTPDAPGDGAHYGSSGASIDRQRARAGGGLASTALWGVLAVLVVLMLVYGFAFAPGR